MPKQILITGGAGFIGAAIVKELIAKGHKVRILDNLQRGNLTKLKDVKGKFEFVKDDIRDPKKVVKAALGCSAIIHLAYVNGTKFFYSNPDLVLDIGVKGMLSVLEACKLPGIKELYLASSSEVYQDPTIIPTPEDVPLVIPDPYNPRYSYGGGKILCELLAIHAASKSLNKTVIFRPHNVYGPDMGNEHAIPEIMTRMSKLSAAQKIFQIQGAGSETRSYMYIDDFAKAFLSVFEKGKNLETYNIGTEREISSIELTRMISQVLKRKVTIKSGKLRSGSTTRRCPSTKKLKKLGFKASVSLEEGLIKTAGWYVG